MIKKGNGWEMHEGRILVIGISDGKDEGEIRGNQRKGKERRHSDGVLNLTYIEGRIKEMKGGEMQE